MLKIRNGAFETNSSNTHSISIVPNNTFIDWINNKCLFNANTEEFVYGLSIEERNNLFFSGLCPDDFDEDADEIIYEGAPITFDEWNTFILRDYEYFQHSALGVTAFGYYGDNY